MSHYTGQVPDTRPRGAHWADAAACRSVDPELWYPGIGQSAAPAVRICRGCPVQARCLAEALAVESPTYRFGIWGGTTPSQRKAVAGR